MAKKDRATLAVKQFRGMLFIVGSTAFLVPNIIGTAFGLPLMPVPAGMEAGWALSLLPPLLCLAPHFYRSCRKTFGPAARQAAWASLLLAAAGLLLIGYAAVARDTISVSACLAVHVMPAVAYVLAVIVSWRASRV